MPATALIVEFKLKPGSRAAFDQIMLEHARKTLEEEPGCQQFDVLYPEGDEDRVLLIEVYCHQEAYQAHRNGPRMAVVNEALGPLTLERTRTIGTLA